MEIDHLNLDELQRILNESIELVYENDFHLIKNNLSERAIAHKFAYYLTNKLSEYKINVDVEYNGDVENIHGNFRKRVKMLTEKLNELGKEFKNDDDVQGLLVYPDIIIHKRGENKANSLIIEIKKEYKGRVIDDQFDRLKLYHYTTDHHGNNLKYKLGAYVEFDTAIDQKSYRVDYYQNGDIIIKTVVNETGLATYR